VSPVIEASAVSLFYEEHGSGDDVVLLIAGRGGQLTDWHDELVDQFVDDGHRVIRFDNRDAGLSTHFDDVVPADVSAIMQGSAQPPYSLDDMADDAAELLQALGVEQATVAGHSLGAMIGQCLAIRHPHLVRGLVLMAGTTGEAGVGLPSPEVLQLLMSGSLSSAADDPVEAAVRSSSQWTSWELGVTEEDLRARVKARIDRRYDRAGVARQVAAIVGAADRTSALQRFDLPAVVIHGKDDPLVGFDGGEALAKAIPHADFIAIDKLRHDVPRAIWPTVVAAVERVSRG
jgi:pimeloyl-ACP methyl ester carboxylesterase